MEARVLAIPNKVIQIFTSTIEIVVSSENSNNSRCIFIETAPPGEGPPPHKHLREDEVFLTIELDVMIERTSGTLP
jgi:hypothetical protein